VELDPREWSELEELGRFGLAARPGWIELETADEIAACRADSQEEYRSSCRSPRGELRFPAPGSPRRHREGLPEPADQHSTASAPNAATQTERPSKATP
jgi:hypothetical protein